MSELTKAAKCFINAEPKRQSIEEYETELRDMDRFTPRVEKAFDKARAIRLGHDVIFYIAGPLTRVDDATKQRYADASSAIAAASVPGSRLFGYAPHLHGTDPIKDPDVPKKEVRDIDHLWAAIMANGHFNFWIPIAHGNGIEEGWAEDRRIPSLYVLPKDYTPSRLVGGMWNTAGANGYQDFATDGLSQVQEFLGEFQELRLGHIVLPLADGEQA